MSAEHLRKVGYKSPPLHTRFKKGKSGNPSGRSRDRPKILSLLREELEAPLPVRSNGKKDKMSSRQIQARNLVDDALRGDNRSIRELFDIIMEIEHGSDGFFEPVTLVLDKEDEDL